MVTYTVRPEGQEEIYYYMLNPSFTPLNKKLSDEDAGIIADEITFALLNSKGNIAVEELLTEGTLAKLSNSFKSSNVVNSRDKINKLIVDNHWKENFGSCKSLKEYYEGQIHDRLEKGKAETVAFLTGKSKLSKKEREEMFEKFESDIKFYQEELKYLKEIYLDSLEKFRGKTLRHISGFCGKDGKEELEIAEVQINLDDVKWYLS